MLDSDQTFDPEAHPRRLNVGCGFDHRAGYVNVDFEERHDPDLLADVRDLSMLPSGEYDEVLAIDVLEHLPRSDTAACLTEWHRVLRSGGELRLQVPDVVACGRLLMRRDTVEQHEQLVHQLWGTQAYTGDFHLSGFTDLLVIEALHRTGFHRIELQSRDLWQMQVRAEKVAGDPDPLAIGWVQGVYDLETDGVNEWRWCDGRGTLLIYNLTDQPIDVEVAFSPTTPAASRAKVRIRVGAIDDTVSNRARWKRRLRVPPGATRIRFDTEAPAVADPADPRALVLRLGNPQITLQTS
jgi:hypothetical protein